MIVDAKESLHPFPAPLVAQGLTAFADDRVEAAGAHPREAGRSKSAHRDRTARRYGGCLSR